MDTQIKIPVIGDIICYCLTEEDAVRGLNFRFYSKKGHALRGMVVPLIVSYSNPTNLTISGHALVDGQILWLDEVSHSLHTAIGKWSWPPPTASVEEKPQTETTEVRILGYDIHSNDLETAILLRDRLVALIDTRKDLSWKGDIEIRYGTYKATVSMSSETSRISMNQMLYSEEKRIRDQLRSLGVRIED